MALVKKKSTGFVIYQGEPCFYTIKELDAETSYFYCKAAGISQEFLNEDLPALIKELPDFIESEREWCRKNSVESSLKIA